MADIRPFKAVRPAEGWGEIIAALPYDVYSREEARRQVEKEPHSFLAIDRPETQFDAAVDMYSDRVYQKAAEMLQQWKEEGSLIQDAAPCYYLYELTMNGRSQTGIGAVCSMDDYLNGVIKKHENTRAEKELDRIRHVDTCNAQTGPIFLAYRANADINAVATAYKRQRPVYSFTKEDGITHRLWVISDTEDIAIISQAFAGMKSIYIADGHHRCASAVRVGVERRNRRQDKSRQAESDYFLSVLFPDEELMIMDYNRVVMDLAELTEEEFLQRIAQFYCVEPLPDGMRHPAGKGEICLCLKSGWYRMQVKDELKNEDPVNGLDVSILQKYVLDDILGIRDPKTDKRIDFVGGIRGLSELEKRVRNGAAAAFAMYPTSIQELFAVADAGRLMPPKSTWFEPKLRSGLLIHEIESKIQPEGK